MNRKLVRIPSFLVLAFACIVVLSSVSQAAVVTVRDPAFGLPHVCADTDLEAARQQGYEAAADRLAQFLLVMGVARGTICGAICNLVGDFLGDDIETRRQGYSRSEFTRMFARLPQQSQDILLAYADGVNAAIQDMVNGSLLTTPVELTFFKSSVAAGPSNLFGNGIALTLGEGADPHYLPPGQGPYPSLGFQFTPELSLAFAVLQVRQFGNNAWNELGMAADLDKLVTQYGTTAGTELWDDRYYLNDPLAPVSVPDPRSPGFGGDLSALSLEKRIEIAKTTQDLRDKVLGRTRLPGYPKYDYSAAVEPRRKAREMREARAREWGAWPALGSYAMLVSPGRSATGNPWVGGFPQTGIQVPSIMHYSEMHGDTITANGMFFVGAPFALIGHNDHVAFTTTTAQLKLVDTYIETLVNGNFALFKYDHHGTTADMVKRIELIRRPNNAPNLQVPVFRTNKICSANGCTGGDRPVEAFAGDVAGTATSASSTTLTDTGASLPNLAGGYIAIVDGTGAGQMRPIDSNTTTTITISSTFSPVPDSTSKYVAVASGNNVTAVAFESALWMEEPTTAVAFSKFQEANDVLDMRSAVRLMPSTHNFFSADGDTWNGVGTNSGTGNIHYATSGYHRVRQNAVDDRLPLDGTAPNGFEVASGVVTSASATTLSDTGAFTSLDLASEPINFTYDNPDDNGEDYIVVITAGNGHHQTRRIASNSDDTLTVEHDWGTVPSAGDTYAIYQIYAMPEAMNPSEGFTANWNNKQSVANDIEPGRFGRNHRAEVLLEQMSLDNSITRDDLRGFNKYLAGVQNPGTPGRYLLDRLEEAITAHGDCGTIDDDLITNDGFPERGREFINPLIGEPAGTAVVDSLRTAAPQYVRNWATQLAADIYGNEYDPASVSKLTGSDAIGWVLHAIDDAAGDVPDAYDNAYSGDYFNGQDWEQVVRDSFCSYAASNPTIGTLPRQNEVYNNPLAGLPCSGCSTPIEFDPTPRGNRGTWEQVVEVGASPKGEFIFPMGQSGLITGGVVGFGLSNTKQSYHTTSMQSLWRDWRFAPMLHVCETVDLGGDDDGDIDNDGVLDAFENYYYGNLANDAASDTDGDGADLATEYRWGTDPTLADTDEDGVADGMDAAPQDRSCLTGSTKGKMSVKDSDVAGKDKVTAKWDIPMHMCIGGDNATPCDPANGNADCAIGLCRRVNMNPTKDLLRFVAGDDSRIFEGFVPQFSTTSEAGQFWKVSGTGLKFTYKDKDNVNGPLAKGLIKYNDKKGLIQIKMLAKNIDLPAAPDAAQGVMGVAVGTRCFQEKPTDCKLNNGKLSCKIVP